MLNQINRPNVLLFVFDSLSTDDYLTLAEQLPCIESLRKQGAWFTRAYCGCPESSPARASLFTGLDMAAHGLWTDGVTLPAHETTMAEQFTKCGYQTSLFGRRHLAGVANWTTEHSKAQEFCHTNWAHGPLHRSRQNAYLMWLQAIASNVYDDVFPSQADPDDTQIPPWQHKAMMELPNELSFNYWLGHHLGEHISQHSNEQPFFAVAGFVVGELMGATNSNELISEGVNQRALKQADSAIATVLEKLKSTGQTDNTILVVASARGSMIPADAKQALQERAIKVPLLINAPGLAASSINSVVSTIDIAATLYPLASVQTPQRLQGTSLLTEEPRQWSLSRLRHPEQQHQSALCTERYKLIAHHASVEYSASAHYSLFDLQQDPTEQINLATSSDHQDLLETMIDQLIDARVALEDRTEPRIAKF